MTEESRKPVKLWEDVRANYMNGDYETVHALSLKWDVNYHTLRDRIYKGNTEEVAWREEKKALEDEVKSHAVSVAKNKLATTYCKTSGMMDSILDKIKAGMESDMFSMRDLPDLYAKLGTALKNVHSTLRLEDGKSTQNIAVNKDSISGMKEALENLKNKGLLDLGDIDELEIVEDDQ